MTFTRVKSRVPFLYRAHSISWRQKKDYIIKGLGYHVREVRFYPIGGGNPGKIFKEKEETKTILKL